MEEGIYFGLPEEAYHAAPGLSCSGMKKLAVSPLNYWHHHFNPEYVRPDETPAQRVGKAAHCRLLEPERYVDDYGREASVADFPGALVTVEDMKAHLAERGLPTTHKRKQDLIDRIRDTGAHPPIWDVEQARHAELHKGKVMLKAPEADMIERMASVVLADPCVGAILSGGVMEVSFFVRDPGTGVMLKARMDYVKPGATIDLKTFSNSRGKPASKAVFDSIYYEGYHVQCVFYSFVRELSRQKLREGGLSTHGLVSERWLAGFAENDRPGFGFVFVESDEPFDTRIVELRRSETRGAGANVYWHAGEIQIANMMILYSECMDRYGAGRWVELCSPHILLDTDLPQLMFA